MSSYEVVERGSAAGIVITASHNPWTDNGFKVKSPSGAAAGPEILAVLEAQIARNGGTAIERRPFAEAEAAGLVERFDPFEGYERFVRRTVDLDALKNAGQFLPASFFADNSGGDTVATDFRRNVGSTPKAG